MIASFYPALTLHALSYGPEAADLAASSGFVSAIVSKAIYLQTQSDRVVSLVGPTMPEGPITVRVPGLDAALPGLASIVQAGFSGDGLAFHIPAHLHVSLARARPWSPPLVALSASTSALKGVTRSLAYVISTQGSHTGLGSLARAIPSLLSATSPGEERSALPSLPPLDPFSRRAAGAIEELGRAWWQGSAARVSGAALHLLGLGPGLTPSGDDFLMGLIAACRWSAPRSERAARLGPALAEAVAWEAPARTTHLSARLLAHASRGLLYEPAMSLGAALFAGHRREMEPAALQLFAIGHSSGTDMAVGLLAGALLLLA